MHGLNNFTFWTKMGSSDKIQTWDLCHMDSMLSIFFTESVFTSSALHFGHSNPLNYSLLFVLLLHKAKKKNIGKKRMLSIFFTESVFSTQTTFWPLFSSQLLSLIFFTATFPSAKKNIGEKGIYSNIFLKSWQQHLQTYMSQYVDFMGRVADQHSILFRGRQLSYHNGPETQLNCSIHNIFSKTWSHFLTYKCPRSLAKELGALN